MAPEPSPSNRLTLRDALFLGFCAVFILVTKAAFRLHLNITGHAMFFMIFFLMLARACVQYRLAATWTGFIAGILAVLLAIGKGGPLILLKFILPALVIDLAAACFPLWYYSRIACLVLAAAAAATKFISTGLVSYLAGMDWVVLLQHATIKSLSGVVFAMAGSLFVPTVIDKLQAHGIIDSPRNATEPPPMQKSEDP